MSKSRTMDIEARKVRESPLTHLPGQISKISRCLKKCSGSTCFRCLLTASYDMVCIHTGTVSPRVSQHILGLSTWAQESYRYRKRRFKIAICSIELMLVTVVEWFDVGTRNNPFCWKERSEKPKKYDIIKKLQTIVQLDEIK